jgi:hypothetical protein
MSLTHRESVLKTLGLPHTVSLSMHDMSRIFGVPIEALIAVYRRGLGAAKTNVASVRLKKDFSKNPDLRKYPRSARLSSQQWASARVWSFLDGMLGNASGSYDKADADIARRFGL